MDLIDKKGYLKSALRYIEKDIASDRNLKKLAEKAGINEVLIKNLSVSLKKFSEKYFFTVLQEKIEEKHSSLSGAEAEISGVDISLEKHKNKAFVLMNLILDIVSNDEKEDRIELNIKIFSNPIKNFPPKIIIS